MHRQWPCRLDSVRIGRLIRRQLCGMSFHRFRKNYAKKIEINFLFKMTSKSANLKPANQRTFLLQSIKTR